MTNRTYETMLLLDNQEVKRNWQGLKDEVCGLFTKHGADIKGAKVWEERRLAYPIQHHLRATYFVVYHEGDTQSQAAINRDLTYAEPVLRHLSVVCEELPESFESADDFDPEQVRYESSFQEPDAPAEEKAEGGEAEAGAEGGGSGDGDSAKDKTEAKTEAKAEGDAPAAEASEGASDESADKNTDDDKKEGDS